MEDNSIGTSSNHHADAGMKRKNAAKDDQGSVKKINDDAKRGRFDRCFSFMEISIDPGVKSLKQLDSNKFKQDIRRWAKRVAAYARQLSGSFGSSRR